VAARSRSGPLALPPFVLLAIGLTFGRRSPCPWGLPVTDRANLTDRGDERLPLVE
jgi:hypothetical protein